MLAYLWLFMIIVSFFCSILTGNVEALAMSITEGADKAIKLLLSMAGVMCLWTGIMKIGDKSGLTDAAARLLSPVLERLMPEQRHNSKAMRSVAANVTANILGLGNAATPLGIKAMREMAASGDERTLPDRSMILFVVINTASLQLIPTTAAALRQAAGSTQPYSILPCVWISSAAALAAGISAAKLFGAWRKNG